MRRYPLLCVLLAVLPAGAAAQPEAVGAAAAAEAPTASSSAATPVTVFDLPRLEAVRDAVAAALGRGDADGAARLLDRSIADTPDLPDLYVLRALVAMRGGDAAAALADLGRAVDRGYGDLDAVLDDTLLAPLRGAATTAGLVTRSAAQAAPDTRAPARLTPEGQLLVTEDALDWDARIRRWRVATDLPAADGPPPRLPGKAGGDAGRAATLNLNRLLAQGRAAGFRGLLYDNRDGGHSRMPMDGLPGMVPIRYGPALREQGLSYGIASDLLFDRITVGNSSTAYKRGRAPRSLVRAMMTRTDGPLQAWIGFMGNHVYVYPEHRDHDAVDRYPANWPYTITSQGSSYDDRPFVRAAAFALAALSPETRAVAARDGLAAATVQMILRRSQAGIRTRGDYRGARAHPSAFAQDRIRLDRIVGLAASLTPETLPPLPVIAVESETFSDSAGLLDRSERLFDTPQSVARIWRGFAAEHEMVLTAHAVGGPLAESAGFHWQLMRGDPDRVRIVPLGDGRRARVTIGWHERAPLGEGASRLGDRVEIAVFATTPDHDSAPAFVSVLFPTHQDRIYAPGPDGRVRLVSVDYSGKGRPGGQDPLLFWRGDWRDRAVYGAGGRQDGWRRSLAGGPEAPAPDAPPEGWTLDASGKGLPRLTPPDSAAPGN